MSTLNDDELAAYNRAQAEMMREWAQERAEERLRDIEKLVPRRYRNASENDLHPKLKKWKPGESVYLYGDSGAGKTHQLAILARLQAEQSHLPVWFDSIELVDSFRRSQRDDALYPSNAFMCSTVIIDDLGKERLTDYALEQVFAVVNHAYQNERCLLISSELDPRQLAARTTPAIARRIVEMTGGGCELKRGWWKQ